MKKVNTMLGILAAGAAAGLLGSTALAAGDAAGAVKACYRPHCGKSVQGHEGKCGGTIISQLQDEKSCEGAGGAWTTAADAKKFEKKDS